MRTPHLENMESGCRKVIRAAVRDCDYQPLDRLAPQDTLIVDRFSGLGTVSGRGKARPRDLSRNCSLDIVPSVARSSGARSCSTFETSSTRTDIRYRGSKADQPSGRYATRNGLVHGRLLTPSTHAHAALAEVYHLLLKRFFYSKRVGPKVDFDTSDYGPCFFR